MSPTPPPRSGESETVTVLSMMVSDLRGLRETVASGFRDLSADIARLRDEAVLRREFDRYRDERTVQDAEERLAMEKAIIAARQDAVDDLKTLKDELAATSGLKRWVIGTLLAAAASAGAIGSLVEQTIHHH